MSYHIQLIIGEENPSTYIKLHIVSNQFYVMMWNIYAILVYSSLFKIDFWPTHPEPISKRFFYRTRGKPKNLWTAPNTLPTP